MRVVNSGRALRHIAAAIAAALASAALVATALADGAPASGAADAALEHAKQVLESTILIDGHNDLPYAIRGDKTAPGDVDAYDLRTPRTGQTDLARLREGRLGGQFWSVYVPGEGSGGFARYQLEQIDLARRIIERYPEALRFATSVAEVRAAKRDGRIASLLGMEGGHAIENSLGALRAYYDLGVRYMTLTHNTHTDWADSVAETPPRHHGLTPFGEEVVREMNRLGMLVDLSHTSPETMADTIRVSQAPVIFSHSGARGVCDVPRNVPDEILREMPHNGGVVMVPFVAGFVDCAVAAVTQPAFDEYNRRVRGVTDPKARQALSDEIFNKLVIPTTTAAKVADQIEYVRKVAGVDHVGIGSDFDGGTKWPVDLSDVSMYPVLFAELIRRGWTDEDLRKLAGENVLRALGEAERAAKRLQQERPASIVKFAP